MDFMTAMKISGSALKAERCRINIASMNMANANTTRTIEGGPYRAKSVVFTAKPLDGSFRDVYKGVTDKLRTVGVGFVEDKTPFKEVYDPSHPDADKLRVCKVNVGDDEPLNIVCGAANVRTVSRMLGLIERIPMDELRAIQDAQDAIAATAMLNDLMLGQFDG